MALSIRPVYDRLVVRKIEQADKTKSGLLVIPEQAKSPSQMGLVLAVGDGRNYDGPGGQRIVGSDGVAIQFVEFMRPRMSVRVGDRVLFGKFSGSEIQIGEETVFILREDEVMAVVEGEEDEPAPAEEPPAA